MEVLQGMQLTIHLDSDQQFILIAHKQDLLVDTSRKDKAFPIQVQ